MARTKRDQGAPTDGSQRQAQCCTAAILNLTYCRTHAPRLGIEVYRATTDTWVLRG